MFYSVPFPSTPHTPYLFAIVDDSNAFECEPFLASDLSNRPFRRQVAVQRLQVTCFFDWLRHWKDNRLACRVHTRKGESACASARERARARERQSGRDGKRTHSQVWAMHAHTRAHEALTLLRISLSSPLFPSHTSNPMPCTKRSRKTSISVCLCARTRTHAHARARTWSKSWTFFQVLCNRLAGNSHAVSVNHAFSE